MTTLPPDPVNQITVKELEQKTPVNVSQKVAALFQFASLALLTQVTMLLNQVVLLPIQLRVWGTDQAAYWYSVVAVAAVTSIADFGLRSAGHAELLRHVNDPNDHEARKEFQDLWAWIRILVASTTVILVVTDFVYHHLYLGVDYPLWRPAFVLGYAMEVIFGVRCAYLDTQGLYRQSEAGYLLLASVRLVLSIGALLFFHAPPAVIAWIYFGTGIFSIIQQSQLCRKAGRLHLFEEIPKNLSWGPIATIRHTVADPFANWVKMNLPVLILAVIAAPIAVVSYVALRAFFGAARAVIQQMSRFASVEFLSLRQAGEDDLAEMHLSVLVVGTAFLASGVAGFVIADNGRLASLILNKMDLPIYQFVAVTFGLGNAFFVFLILQSVSRRAGEIAQVAHRQYLYVIFGAIFAAIALAMKSMVVWLVLMMWGDMFSALTFMMLVPRTSILTTTSAGRRGSAAAAASTVMILAMWLIVHYENFAFLRGTTVSDALCTIAFFLVGVLLVGVVDLFLVVRLRARGMTLPVALLEWVKNIRAARLQNG